jgi:hypothetical protein
MFEKSSLSFLLKINKSQIKRKRNCYWKINSLP